MNNNYKQTISSLKFWDSIIYALILLGSILRIFHFFNNRSLWLDEMYLSSSLIKMGLKDLAISALDYQQKAPLGYLWFSKLCVYLFGDGEMALRLFPLICGVASLFIFLKVCRYFTESEPAIAVAIGILALSPPLIYHSVEAKQYSTELFITILSLYLYVRFHNSERIKSMILWGFLGAILIWFSFPSIFILAGIAGGSSLYFIIKKKWRKFFICLIPFLMWMISFGINYFLLSTKNADSEWLFLWFRNRGGFMPLNLTEAILWFLQKPMELLNFPLGTTWFFLPKKYNDNYLLLLIVRMAFIPLTLIFIGFYVTFKKHLKDFLILMFPLLLHLTAAAAGFYPFFERLTVYLSPILILFIILGFDHFLDLIKIKKTKPTNVSPLKINWKTKNFYYQNKWATLIVALILLGPLMQSSKDFLFPDGFGRFKSWHQREFYQYLNKNFKEGDIVYIYWNALVPYNYYKQVNDYKFKAIEGKDYRFSANSLKEYYTDLNSDFQSLKKHNRVWFIYALDRDSKIGDFDGKPAWYYHGNNHLKTTMADEIKKLGTVEYSMKTRENFQLLMLKIEQ